MSEQAGGTLELIGAYVAHKVTQGGAIAGVAGWLASVNWVGLIGAGAAIIGLITNIYFQSRRDRREAAESRARLEAMKERCDLGR